jgi:hypothetical protein
MRLSQAAGELLNLLRIRWMHRNVKEQGTGNKEPG